VAAVDEAEILFALIRHRYADRLDAAQLEELRKTVDGLVRDLAALRAVTMADDEEPAQPFIPYRADPYPRGGHPQGGPRK
jgi:hypothetical protein